MSLFFNSGLFDKKLVENRKKIKGSLKNKIIIFYFNKFFENFKTIEEM